MAGRTIFGQRVQNQWIGNLGDNFNRLQARRLNLVEILANLRPRLDQFFAALGIDDRQWPRNKPPEAGRP